MEGGPSVAERIADVEAAIPVALTPEQAARVFALGSKATDLQRQRLERELVGHVVEWPLRVYDVDLAEGLYTVTSQAIPVDSANALALLRIVAFIKARHAEDETRLETIQTDDLIRVRGQVQSILARTVVTLGPAVIVEPRVDPAQPE